jgi:hypothetical protein
MVRLTFAAKAAPTVSPGILGAALAANAAPKVPDLFFTQIK